MAQSSRNPLAIMHSALSNETVRGILGILSTDDMHTLGRFLADGTLMSSLQPLLDEASKAAAVGKMRPALGPIIDKIPEANLTALKTELLKLPVAEDNSRLCGC